MEKPIKPANCVHDFAQKLPNVAHLIEQLTNMDKTVEEILQFVDKLEKENRDLKSQLLDMQKHFLMTTSHVYPIEIQ
jgi:cell shape-determining protein MreC